MGLNREIKPYPTIAAASANTAFSSASIGDASLPLPPLLPMNGAGNYQECVRLVDELIHQKSFETPSQVSEEVEFQRFQSLFEGSNIAEPLDSFDRIELQNSCRVSPIDGNKADSTSKAYHCGFGGLPLPSITPSDHFLAIENFFYTSEFFDILEESHPVQSLISAGDSFCSKHWEEILIMYPNEPRDDLEKYCFSSAYIRRVLESGLGFERLEREWHEKCRVDQVADQAAQLNQQRDDKGICINDEGMESLGSAVVYKNLRFTKFINGVSLDWALGAVLKLITDQLHRNEYQGLTTKPHHTAESTSETNESIKSEL